MKRTHTKPQATQPEPENARVGQIYALMSQCTIPELREVALIHTDLWRRKMQALARSYVKGDRVEFTRSTTGEIIVGVVRRINQKSVTLLTDGGSQWKVSPSMLRPSDRPVIALASRTRRSK